MMKRYLLIFLLSGMDTGALKAEKVLDGFDEEPFEQPVILPEKTRLSSVPCLLQVVEVAANRWPGLNGKAGTDWIAAELFFQLNGCSITLGRQLFLDARQPVLPVGSRLLFSGSLPAVPDTGAFRGMRVPGSAHLQRAVVAGELGL